MFFVVVLQFWDTSFFNQISTKIRASKVSLFGDRVRGHSLYREHQSRLAANAFCIKLKEGLSRGGI